MSRGEQRPSLDSSKRGNAWLSEVFWHAVIVAGRSRPDAMSSIDLTVTVPPTLGSFWRAKGMTIFENCIWLLAEDGDIRLFIFNLPRPARVVIQ